MWKCSGLIVPSEPIADFKITLVSEYTDKEKKDMNDVQEKVNKMLKDLEILKDYFEYNQQRRITINEYRQDLDELFKIFPKDPNQEDYRTNLIVLLLDIIDQIDIYKFKKDELDVIIDMTKSLLSPVTGEKLDNYIEMVIEKDMYLMRLPNGLAELYLD